MNVENSEAILLIPDIHIGRHKRIALLHEGDGETKEPAYGGLSGSICIYWREATRRIARLFYLSSSISASTSQDVRLAVQTPAALQIQSGGCRKAIAELVAR